MANYILWNRKPTPITESNIFPGGIKSNLSLEERRIFYIPVVLIFPLDGLEDGFQFSDFSGKHHGVVEKAFALWWIQSPSWGWSLLAGQLCVHACLTPCDPMNHSLLGSSVHGILRQEYWSGLPCLPPGDLPNPGIKPTSLKSPELQVDSLPVSHWGSPWTQDTVWYYLDFISSLTDSSSSHIST